MKLITTNELLVRVTKITSRIGASWTHSLPFQFLNLIWLAELAILSKVSKPDNSESQKSLKFSFSNFWEFRSDFVGCESFLEPDSLDILALCETNLEDSIDSSRISVRGSLALIWKDSVTHMQFCILHEGENSFHIRLISRILRDLHLFATDFTSFDSLLPFPLSTTILSF